MPLTEKQKEFVNALKSKKYKSLLYGGAAGGGKSILQIGILHRLSIEYPRTRWGIIRKNRPVLENTSIASFEELTTEMSDHAHLYTFNKKDLKATYFNGSEILFLPADRSKDRKLLKLSGLQFTGALIEECNEVDEGVYDIIRSRTGRRNNTKYGIRPFVMLNCNPDKNWVKDKFYDPFHENKLPDDYYFLQALPRDNPHLSEDYLDTLRDLSEPETQRLYHGNWEFFDDPYQLIRYIWLKEQFHKETMESLLKDRANRFEVCLGIDVARGGGDKTTFAFFVGKYQPKIETYDIEDMTELAQIAKTKADEYEISAERIGIDVIGPGGWGLYCDLNRLLKSKVYAFNGSEKPDRIPNNFQVYKNKRAQAHWELREDIRKGDIFCLNHKEFIKEASNIHYMIKDGGIQIQSKEGIKKTLGYSPDHFDAVVIANYVRKNIHKKPQKALAFDLDTKSNSLDW